MCDQYLQTLSYIGNEYNLEFVNKFKKKIKIRVNKRTGYIRLDSQEKHLEIKPVCAHKTVMQTIFFFYLHTLRQDVTQYIFCGVPIHMYTRAKGKNCPGTRRYTDHNSQELLQGLNPLDRAPSLVSNFPLKTKKLYLKFATIPNYITKREVVTFFFKIHL